MNSRFEDEPRSLKRKEVWEERKSFLRDPHVAKLTAFVDELREKTGREGDIPYFDPLDGGQEARCLFLFEAPGRKAVDSGFVSRNNDDQTAHNFFCINREAGLDRHLTISWNIVPWALREGGRNQKPGTDEIQKGLRYLEVLFKLLRPLKVVVLCGLRAQKATQFVYECYPKLCVFHAPHPSPQSLNQPGKRAYLGAAISKVVQKVCQ